MTTETDVSEHVEDEPGFGYFSIAVGEGKDPLLAASDVPAIKMKGTSEEYIELQKKKGLPIIAFRNGGRGMCSVAVNQNLIEVNEVNLKIPRDQVNVDRSLDLVITGVIKTTSLPTNEFYKTLFVPPGVRGPKNELVSSLEIIARTRAGLPFKAIVSFVPSISR